MEQIAYYQSPLGIIEVRGNGVGITYTQFVTSRPKGGTAIAGHLESPQGIKTAKKTTAVTSAHVKTCLKQLKEYFEGKREKFDLKLAASGTEFQKKVWKALVTIPYGKTSSYGDIAKKIGSPKASRAVGGANNKNPIAIIVPCHRVIGSNGAMVGYASGVSKKEWLLQLENKYPSNR